jgi:hypothetical protein
MRLLGGTIHIQTITMGPYLLIMAFNVNVFNVQLKDMECQNWGGTKSNDKLLRKDLFNLNNTLKLKSEGDEKDTSYKWKTKESRGSDNYIRQNRF